MNSKRQDSEPNALDALRLYGLTRHQQICAIAAEIARSAPRFRSRKSFAPIIRLLVDTDDEAEQFMTELDREINRQWKLSGKRKVDLSIGEWRSATAGQVVMQERINRLSRSVFGPVDYWVPLNRMFRRGGNACYGWYKRDASGVRIAGIVLHYYDHTSQAGFAIKQGFDRPTKFAVIPSSTDSYKDLLVVLGLPPQFIDSGTTVDWHNRRFIVSKTSTIPWVNS